MKIQELLEADEPKKYVDKDGKKVRQLPRKPTESKSELQPSVATKRGPVRSKINNTPTKEDLFGKTGYDSRIRLCKKGERQDVDFVGDIFRFAHEKNGKLYYIGKDGKPSNQEMATVKVVGTTKLQHPMTEEWHDAQTLELHFDNGAIVPAIRLRPNGVISQDYRYKAYMPSGTAKFWSLIRDHNNR